jgi:hypothetical protein
MIDVKREKVINSDNRNRDFPLLIFLINITNNIVANDAKAYSILVTNNVPTNKEIRINTEYSLCSK